MAFSRKLQMRGMRYGETVELTLPRKTWSRIDKILDADPLFESPQDLLLHAVTDFLESYNPSVAK